MSSRNRPRPIGVMTWRSAFSGLGSLRNIKTGPVARTEPALRGATELADGALGSLLGRLERLAKEADDERTGLAMVLLMNPAAGAVLAGTAEDDRIRGELG